MQFHWFNLTRGGNEFRGVLRLSGDGEALPALLFVPDLLYSSRHGFYPWLMDRLAARALVLCLDSLSGHGPPDSALQDCATGYSLGGEIADCVTTLRALKERELPRADLWDGRRVFLCGHGKGAAAALHLERRMREEGLDLDGGLVLLSAPATLARDGGGSGDEGAGLRVPTDGGDTVELGRGFVEDARALSEQAPLPELVATSTLPMLVLHGEEDRRFPIVEVESLLAAAPADRVQLVVVEKAGHDFGGGDPFSGPGRALEEVARLVERFVSPEA